MPDIDTREFSGDQVAAPRDLMNELRQYVGEPLVKLPTGGHYWLQPEWGIPSDTIAVPQEPGVADDDNETLLARGPTAKRLVNAGVIDAP